MLSPMALHTAVPPATPEGSSKFNFKNNNIFCHPYFPQFVCRSIIPSSGTMVVVEVVESSSSVGWAWQGPAYKYAYNKSRSNQMLTAETKSNMARMVFINDLLIVRVVLDCNLVACHMLFTDLIGLVFCLS